MNDEETVPCGLYRTTQAIGESVPEGSLVYYHNHGDPGPGVYPAESWVQNKAKFSKRGVLIPDAAYADSLEPLRSEGFYRVSESFYCCDKHCRQFEPDTLVQLGYNGHGQAIVFVPEWGESGFHLPEKGTPVDTDRLDKLQPLKIARAQQPPASTECSSVH
mgnify:CR=1 FL=1